MADTRTPEQRRRIMQAVKTRNTGPELVVRRVLFRLGYRYRLNAKKIPGRPDIVFPGRMRAIFVHGCFWHGHGCAKGQAPKSRLEYWQPKLKANRDRDAAQLLELEKVGWSVMAIWQCEIHDEEVLAAKLKRFLDSVPNSASRAAQIG